MRRTRYPAILAVTVIALIISLGNKPAADVTILRAAGTPFTLLPNDQVSNQIRIKVVNRTRAKHSYSVTLLEPKDVKLINPRGSVSLGPNESTTFTMFMISKRSAYKDGKRDVRLRVSGDDGFERDLDHHVLGPSEGNDQ